MKLTCLSRLSAVFAVLAALVLPALSEDSPAAPAKAAAGKGKSKSAAPATAKPADAAAKKPDEEKKDAAPTPPVIHTMKRGEFELKVELDGIFETAQETPIGLNPEEWSDLTLVSVVPHGTVVKKGDLLARFETKKLEEQIADLEKGMPLAELNLQLARQEIGTLEKTTPLSLDAARRTKMEGEQDLAYFEDVARALKERDAKEDVKRLEQSLSYSREELNQLEKMYKADDLTEETEEIILTRSRNEVAYYEWMLDQTKARSARALNTAIPREHRAQQVAVENAEIAWRQAEQSLPETLQKKRLEADAQELALRKSHEKLGALKKDLESLTVKAPHDGIVYYGASSRGKWVTAAMLDRKLVPGGKLTPSEVFLTVVKTAPLRIRAAVPENRLRHLAEGLNGVAAPGWDAESEFPTVLETLSLVPYADNTYDAIFTVPKAGKEIPVLYPGMTAKVRLDLYEAADALTAPRKGVHRDKAGYYVHLKDGSKRRVKVGHYNDAVYEILDGLKEGDEIKVP